jgi:hypothetical protein
MAVEILKPDSHLVNIKEWLLPPDMSTNLNEALKKHHEGTFHGFYKVKNIKTGKLESTTTAVVYHRRHFKKLAITYASSSKDPSFIDRT